MIVDWVILDWVWPLSGIFQYIRISRVPLQVEVGYSKKKKIKINHTFI